MKLVIHREAKWRIRLCYQWCESIFGLTSATRFYERILRDMERLVRFPYLGSREELLLGMRLVYRSLVVRPHFRLIYYVDEAKSEIHVVDFWDTRQDPESLVESLAEE